MFLKERFSLEQIRYGINFLIMFSFVFVTLFFLHKTGYGNFGIAIGLSFFFASFLFHKNKEFFDAVVFNSSLFILLYSYLFEMYHFVWFGIFTIAFLIFTESTKLSNNLICSIYISILISVSLLINFLFLSVSTSSFLNVFFTFKNEIITYYHITLIIFNFILILAYTWLNSNHFSQTILTFLVFSICLIFNSHTITTLFFDLIVGSFLMFYLLFYFLLHLDNSRKLPISIVFISLTFPLFSFLNLNYLTNSIFSILTVSGITLFSITGNYSFFKRILFDFSVLVNIFWFSFIQQKFISENLNFDFFIYLSPLFLLIYYILIWFFDIKNQNFSKKWILYSILLSLSLFLFVFYFNSLY